MRARLTLAALALVLVGCPPPASQPQGSLPLPATRSEPTPSLPEPARRQRVALFVPHKDPFWREFRRFMRAACEQLDLGYEVHLAHNNREEMKAQLRAAVAGPDPVDVVVFQNFKQCGPDLLRMAQDAGVRAFLCNAGVEAGECGRARERYSQWIGTMVPDNEGSGYDLAVLLADAAREQGLSDGQGKVHMIALAGIVSDESSVAHVRGLERAVRERDDIVLQQVMPTDWSETEGELKSATLLRRFPETSVVWTASAPLALSAIRSLRRVGRRPGEDCLVGGYDWTGETLTAVKEGSLYATLGGHFMEGGWVAVLLRDYLDGQDFARQRCEYATPMRAITRQNVERFLPAIRAARWGEVDFQSYRAKGRGDYRFDPVAVLDGLSR
ncbi:MAG TPA: hypothetical protein DEA08_18365 [Planctomycetes bacterium]|nr:hypothetical protein [Planctomycetota bacterium]